MRTSKLLTPHRLVALRDGQDGAAAIEYGLLIGLIALAIFVSLGLFATSLVGIYDAAAAAVSKLG